MEPNTFSSEVIEEKRAETGAGIFKHLSHMRIRVINTLEKWPEQTHTEDSPKNSEPYFLVEKLQRDLENILLDIYLRRDHVAELLCHTTATQFASQPRG